MKQFNLIIAFMACTGLLFAQNLTKTGVMRMKLRNLGVIEQSDQVIGYYYFYQQEKKSKGLISYQLTLVDENLHEIKSTNIIRPDTYIILDGAYNGSSFGFLGFDAGTKSTELLAFSKELKQLRSITRKVSSKYALANYVEIADGRAEPDQPYIVPVANKGFLYFNFRDGSDIHFEITFYDNEFSKIWTEKADDDARIEIGIEGFQDSTFVGSIIGKRKSRTSKDIDFDLLVNRTATGERLFRVPLTVDKYTISISEVYHDRLQGNFVVIGEYYDINDKVMKDQSKGFITAVFDQSGKLVQQKTNSWAEEISKATPFNENGKIEGSNVSVLFHNAVRTSDGQIFLIGEQYKKAVSGAGIAGNILGIAAGAATGYYVTTSSVQVNVYNMVVFQFNPDFSINKVHFFEKSKNTVYVPYGSSYSSAKFLSNYVKATGGFDYAYTQVAPDQSTFIVNYINFARNTNAPSSNVLGSIIYTPEKTLTTDKMPLPRNSSSSLFVEKAKQGYVMVTEYFKKEKRLESRLEKINY